MLIIKNLPLRYFITKQNFKTEYHQYRHFIIITELSHQENTVILSVTELKKSIDRSKIIVKEFNTYLSAIDRTIRQKN